MIWAEKRYHFVPPKMVQFMPPILMPEFKNGGQNLAYFWPQMCNCPDGWNSGLCIVFKLKPNFCPQKWFKNCPQKSIKFCPPFLISGTSFGGQKLLNFGGTNLHSFLITIRAPRNVLKNAPQNIIALSEKVFARSQIFKSLKPKSWADRCQQIADASHRILRSAGLAAAARRGC